MSQEVHAPVAQFIIRALAETEVAAAAAGWSGKKGEMGDPPPSFTSAQVRFGAAPGFVLLPPAVAAALQSGRGVLALLNYFLIQRGKGSEEGRRRSRRFGAHVVAAAAQFAASDECLAEGYGVELEELWRDAAKWWWWGSADATSSRSSSVIALVRWRLAEYIFKDLTHSSGVPPSEKHKILCGDAGATITIVVNMLKVLRPSLFGQAVRQPPPPSVSSNLWNTRQQVGAQEEEEEEEEDEIVNAAAANMLQKHFVNQQQQHPQKKLSPPPQRPPPQQPPPPPQHSSNKNIREEEREKEKDDGSVEEIDLPHEQKEHNKGEQKRQEEPGESHADISHDVDGGPSMSPGSKRTVALQQPPLVFSLEDMGAQRRAQQRIEEAKLKRMKWQMEREQWQKGGGGGGGSSVPPRLPPLTAPVVGPAQQQKQPKRRPQQDRPQLRWIEHQEELKAPYAPRKNTSVPPLGEQHKTTTTSTSSTSEAEAARQLATSAPTSLKRLPVASFNFTSTSMSQLAVRHYVLKLVRIQAYLRYRVSATVAHYLRQFNTATLLFQARYRLLRHLRAQRRKRRALPAAVAKEMAHRCYPVLEQLQVRWNARGELHQQFAWKYIELMCPKCVDLANALLATPMPFIAVVDEEVRFRTDLFNPKKVVADSEKRAMTGSATSSPSPSRSTRKEEEEEEEAAAVERRASLLNYTLLLPESPQQGTNPPLPTTTSSPSPLPNAAPSEGEEEKEEEVEPLLGLFDGTVGKLLERQMGAAEVWRRSILSVQAAARAHNARRELIFRAHAVGQRLFARNASLLQKLAVAFFIVVYEKKIVRRQRSRVIHRPEEKRTIADADAEYLFGPEVERRNRKRKYPTPDSANPAFGECVRCRPIVAVLQRRMVLDHRPRIVEPFKKLMCSACGERGVVAAMVEERRSNSIHMWFRAVTLLRAVVTLCPGVVAKERAASHVRHRSYAWIDRAKNWHHRDVPGWGIVQATPTLVPSPHVAAARRNKGGDAQLVQLLREHCLFLFVKASFPLRDGEKTEDDAAMRIWRRCLPVATAFCTAAASTALRTEHELLLAAASLRRPARVEARWAALFAAVISSFDSELPVGAERHKFLVSVGERIVRGLLEFVGRYCSRVNMIRVKCAHMILRYPRKARSREEFAWRKRRDKIPWCYRCDCLVSMIVKTTNTRKIRPVENPIVTPNVFIARAADPARRRFKIYAEIHDVMRRLCVHCPADVVAAPGKTLPQCQELDRKAEQEHRKAAFGFLKRRARQMWMRFLVVMVKVLRNATRPLRRRGRALGAEAAKQFSAYSTGSSVDRDLGVLCPQLCDRCYPLGLYVIQRLDGAVAKLEESAAAGGERQEEELTPELIARQMGLLRLFAVYEEVSPCCASKFLSMVVALCNRRHAAATEEARAAAHRLVEARRPTYEAAEERCNKSFFDNCAKFYTSIGSEMLEAAKEVRRRQEEQQLFAGDGAVIDVEGMKAACGKAVNGIWSEAKSEFCVHCKSTIHSYATQLKAWCADDVDFVERLKAEFTVEKDLLGAKGWNGGEGSLSQSLKGSMSLKSK